MFTAFASPTHFLSEQVDMPTLEDALGSGAKEFRRRYIRGLRRWNLEVPGQAEKLDELMGLLEQIQGDSPIWFDGAGTIEVVDPILIGVGDGSTTYFILPHRFVFVASAIIYVDGAASNTWTPLGDGVMMDAINFGAAIDDQSIITVKYRRKAKCVLRTSELATRERQLRVRDDPTQTIYRMRFSLEEIAV